MKRNTNIGRYRKREREREKKVNYLLKVEVSSTKARKFSGIRVIRRILKIVIMKSAAVNSRKQPASPPNLLFRYFPNTGAGVPFRVRVSSTRGWVFNNTRDKTNKGGPELSTYPFLFHLSSPRFLDGIIGRG